MTLRHAGRAAPLLAIVLSGFALSGGCQGASNRGGGGAPLTGGPEGPSQSTTPCVLTRIVDGDTVECDPVGRIRLIGMDSPELAQAPFGARAGEALARLAPVGSRLEVEYDVERRDPYDRVLGYLWQPGSQDPLLLNWALVRQGYAVLLTIPPNVNYVEALTEAQEAARGDRAGLWAVDGFACEPADFRAGRCGPGEGTRDH